MVRPKGKRSAFTRDLLVMTSSSGRGCQWTMCSDWRKRTRARVAAHTHSPIECGGSSIQNRVEWGSRRAV